MDGGLDVDGVYFWGRRYIIEDAECEWSEFTVVELIVVCIVCMH